MSEDHRDRWLARRLAETGEPAADDLFVGQVMAGVRRHARWRAARDVVWRALIWFGLAWGAWVAVPVLTDAFVVAQAPVPMTSATVMAAALALAVTVLVLADYVKIK